MQWLTRAMAQAPGCARPHPSSRPHTPARARPGDGGSLRSVPWIVGKHFGHQMTVGTHASLRTLYEDDPHAAEALCSVKLGLGLVCAAITLPYT